MSTPTSQWNLSTGWRSGPLRPLTKHDRRCKPACLMSGPPPKTGSQHPCSCNLARARTASRHSTEQVFVSRKVSTEKPGLRLLLAGDPAWRFLGLIGATCNWAKAYACKPAYVYRMFEIEAVTKLHLMEDKCLFCLEHS